MISKLTKKQIDLFPHFVEKWIKIGTCTRTTDKEAGEKAISLAYQCAGLTPPSSVVWCTSPLALVVARSMSYQSVWASVGASVSNSASNSVRDSVGASVSNSVNNSVRDSVWASVWASVRDSVWASVWASVSNSVSNSVRASVWASVRDSFGGQHESWLSFYDYFHSTGLVDLPIISGLVAVAQEINWWIPCKTIALASTKPVYCGLNEQKLLHADGRKAIEYEDGWGVYAFNGVRMPENIGSVKSSEWNPKWLISEQNAEVRRVLIQEIGYERMMRELEAKHISSFREYSLHRIENVDVEPVQLLSFKCPSTDKPYTLRVPPDVENAEAAATWINHGISPNEFIIEQ